MAACIVCEKDIDTSDGYVSRGLDFTTSGGYGTALFDPMDGSMLCVYVCDDCLRAKQHLATILRDETPYIEPVIVEEPFVAAPKDDDDE